MESTSSTDTSQLPQVAELSLSENPTSGEDKAARPVIRHHTKSRTGCLTCKTRRIKCDEAKPGCERCEKGGFTCDGYVVPESRKSKSTSQRPHTKSRSGCSHCKARRVKCDEAKPKCGWCTKTSQDCQYEEIATKAPSEKRSESRVELQPRYPSVSQLSLNLVLGNEGEKLSFHFYVEKMGPMLAGTCDREFWTRIIIQRTVLDPAIWHCIMALSMLQQQSISRSSDSAGKVLRAQALQHYNKSVACLTRKSTDSQVPTEIMIMSCAVFACIEAVLGDIEGSRRHITSGIGIINDWRKENPSVPAYQRILVEGHIEPIFQNMMSQSSFYVTRNYFEKLKQATYQFENEYRDLDLEKWSPALTFAVEKKNDLLVKSHNWIRSFEGFLRRPAAVDLRVDEIDAIPFMRHQHGVLHLRIETLLRTDELVFDQYHAEFEKAMDQADETLVGVLFRGPKFTTSLLPSLNAEETSLFTVATKCRNPRIRRRALDFMKKTRDQLLFRDDDLSIKVVERAIAAEEEGLQGLLDPTGAEVPSDWARIYEIVIDSRGSDGIVGSHRAAVSFKRKSRTNLGQWVWTCGFVEYDVTECVSSIAQKRC